MGNGCCKQAEAVTIVPNPDGSAKDPQTAEQAEADPVDLRRSAKIGDSGQLERLLRRMPLKDIQSRAKKNEGAFQEEGHTALHFAASRGTLACVELLVLYGADVSSRGAGGATPLHCALQGGRRQVAVLLLEQGADVNAQDDCGATPLLAVLLAGRKRLAAWLLATCGCGSGPAAATGAAAAAGATGTSSAAAAGTLAAVAAATPAAAVTTTTSIVAATAGTSAAAGGSAAAGAELQHSSAMVGAMQVVPEGGRPPSAAAAGGAAAAAAAAGGAAAAEGGAAALAAAAGGPATATATAAGAGGSVAAVAAVPWSPTTAIATSMRIDVGVTDRTGVSACTAAARYGWWDLLEVLVAAAEEPEKALNTRSSDGETPLGWALKYGAAGLLGGPPLRGLVAGLLAAGASAVLPAFDQQIPPLCLAAATGDPEVVSALRAAGASLDPLACRDSVRRNPLHYAAAKGHTPLCSLLLDWGRPRLQPHYRDAGGNSPLHLAAARGHGAAVGLLLERAAQPGKALMAPNRQGVCTYHLVLAAGPGQQAEADALWVLQRLGQAEARRPILVGDQVVDTPLLLAVGSHQPGVVAALLGRGQDPNQFNHMGDTPLSRCLRCAAAPTAAEDAAIFRMLLDAGAVLMGSSSSFSHPLLAVCRTPLSGFTEQVVAVLVGRLGGGSDAVLQWDRCTDGSREGRGPLHLAALYDNAFMTRYLLERIQMPPDIRSGKGLTPLMYAAWGCSLSALKVLLNRGADPRVTDPAGRSVLSYCLRLDRPESLSCAAALLAMGAAPEPCVDVRGEGLLHRAVRYGVSEFIRVWARYGGDLCQLVTTDETVEDPPEQLPPHLIHGGSAMADSEAAAAYTASGAAATVAVAAPAAVGPTGVLRPMGRMAGDYMNRMPRPLEVEEEFEDELAARAAAAAVAAEQAAAAAVAAAAAAGSFATAAEALEGTHMRLFAQAQAQAGAITTEAQSEGGWGGGGVLGAQARASATVSVTTNATATAKAMANATATSTAQATAESGSQVRTDGAGLTGAEVQTEIRAHARAAASAHVEISESPQAVGWAQKTHTFAQETHTATAVQVAGAQAVAATAGARTRARELARVRAQAQLKAQTEAHMAILRGPVRCMVQERAREIEETRPHVLTAPMTLSRSQTATRGLQMAVVPTATTTASFSAAVSTAATASTADAVATAETEAEANITAELLSATAVLMAAAAAAGVTKASSQAKVHVQVRAGAAASAQVYGEAGASASPESMKQEQEQEREKGAAVQEHEWVRAAAEANTGVSAEVNTEVGLAEVAPKIDLIAGTAAVGEEEASTQEAEGAVAAAAAAAAAETKAEAETAATPPLLEDAAEREALASAEVGVETAEVPANEAAAVAPPELEAEARAGSIAEAEAEEPAEEEAQAEAVGKGRSDTVTAETRAEATVESAAAAAGAAAAAASVSDVAAALAAADDGPWGAASSGSSDLEEAAAEAARAMEGGTDAGEEAPATAAVASGVEEGASQLAGRASDGVSDQGVEWEAAAAFEAAMTAAAADDAGAEAHILGPGSAGEAQARAAEAEAGDEGGGEEEPILDECESQPALEVEEDVGAATGAAAATAAAAAALAAAFDEEEDAPAAAAVRGREEAESTQEEESSLLVTLGDDFNGVSIERRNTGGGSAEVDVDFRFGAIPAAGAAAMATADGFSEREQAEMKEEEEAEEAPGRDEYEHAGSSNVTIAAAAAVSAAKPVAASVAALEEEEAGVSGPASDGANIRVTASQLVSTGNGDCLGPNNHYYDDDDDDDVALGGSTLGSLSVPLEAIAFRGSRPVAEAVEAVEAVEAELLRFPSFFQQPSGEEVQRWARLGAEWFDEALPSASDPAAAGRLPALSAHASEAAEEAEEARAALEGDDVTLHDAHLALDADAIWRRMMLCEMKERKHRIAATAAANAANTRAAIGATASQGCAMQGSSSSISSSTDSVTAIRGIGSRFYGFMGRLAHRRDTGGSSSSSSSHSRPPPHPPQLQQSSPAAAPLPSRVRPAASEAVAAATVPQCGSSDRGGAHRTTVPSFSVVPASSPRAATRVGGGSGGGEGCGGDSWMAEVESSVESVLQSVTRGAAAAASGVAGGSGSRAVRAMMKAAAAASSQDECHHRHKQQQRRRQRRRLLSDSVRQDLKERTADELATAATETQRSPGPVAEAREQGEGAELREKEEVVGNGRGGGLAEPDDGSSCGSCGSCCSEGDGGESEDAGNMDGGDAARGQGQSEREDGGEDPYFRKGSRYKGVPRYMDEQLVDVEPAPLSELLPLAGELAERLERYWPAEERDEELLRGADLRERNLKHFLLSLSPSEFPMWPGQWRTAEIRARAAVQTARMREPGQRLQGGNGNYSGAGGTAAAAAGGGSGGGGGLPPMPTRPELRSASALLYAVRLGRPSCVAALLAACPLRLNTPDGWGHTPVAYAAFMAARDRQRSSRLGRVYDMLLARLPQVNFTARDGGAEGAAASPPSQAAAFSSASSPAPFPARGPSLLNPIALAVVMGDASRLAHLVLNCGGDINNCWAPLPHVAAYLYGTWEAPAPPAAPLRLPTAPGSSSRAAGNPVPAAEAGRPAERRPLRAVQLHISAAGGPVVRAGTLHAHQCSRAAQVLGAVPRLAGVAAAPHERASGAAGGGRARQPAAARGAGGSGGDACASAGAGSQARRQLLPAHAAAPHRARRPRAVGRSRAADTPGALGPGRPADADRAARRDGQWHLGLACPPRRPPALRPPLLRLPLLSLCSSSSFLYMSSTFLYMSSTFLYLSSTFLFLLLAYRRAPRPCRPGRPHRGRPPATPPHHGPARVQILPTAVCGTGRGGVRGSGLPGPAPAVRQVRGSPVGRATQLHVRHLAACGAGGGAAVPHPAGSWHRGAAAGAAGLPGGRHARRGRGPGSSRGRRRPVAAGRAGGGAGRRCRAGAVALRSSPCWLWGCGAAVRWVAGDGSCGDSGGRSSKVSRNRCGSSSRGSFCC